MAHLYQITEAYRMLLEEAEENEGVLSEEQNDLLNIAEDQFAEKSEQFCKIIKILESQEDFAEKEIERIKKYQNAIINRKDRIKQALLEAVKVFGNKDPKKDLWRYEIGTFKLHTMQSVQTIVDETIIDDKYKEVAITDRFTVEEVAKISELFDGRTFKNNVTILKTPIKDALKEGQEIVGAELKTNYSLIVK